MSRKNAWFKAKTRISQWNGKSFCKHVLGTFRPSDMIVSTKEVYSYKTPASFGSITSSVNMNDVSFSKLNMEMWRLV